MPKNYLIGIGGTGARVVEAVIHACAAGCGPDDLSVFIIDPDEGNGNLARTKALIADYRACRKGITERHGVTSSLFHTDVATPDPLVWSIFSQQNKTLADFINEGALAQTHRAAADFISVLFSAEELTTPLNEGFRGHPSIGAVVMSNPDMKQHPWKRFWDDVSEASGINAVRVFLVGSIFGGTGAAGVPTFGAREMVKFNPAACVDAAHNQSKILLGGTLVLPYFSFDLDGASAASAKGQLFVTPADFAIATRAALQYYSEKTLAFDQLYVLGDSLAPKVGAFSPGSRTQENKAHYIELASALSAFDFFSQPSPPPDAPAQMFFTAARDGEIVDWQSLPVSRTAEAVPREESQLMLRMATMTAFSYALSTYAVRTLATSHEEVRDAWYRSHFRFNPKKSEEAGRDPRQSDSKSQFETVNRYAKRFLQWICEMDDDSGRVRLVDRQKLVAGDRDDIEVLDYVQHPASIGAFLKGRPGDKDFVAFQHELNDLRMPSSMKAADTVVNLFYQAADRFCRSNYRINPSVATTR